jgi:hypothetical protein
MGSKAGARVQLGGVALSEHRLLSLGSHCRVRFVSKPLAVKGRANITSGAIGMLRVLGHLVLHVAARIVI